MFLSVNIQALVLCLNECLVRHRETKNNLSRGYGKENEFKLNIF